MLPSFLKRLSQASGSAVPSNFLDSASSTRNLPNGGGSYNISGPVEPNASIINMDLSSKLGPNFTSVPSGAAPTGGNIMSTQEMDKLRAMGGQQPGNPAIGSDMGLGLVNGDTTGGSFGGGNPATSQDSSTPIPTQTPPPQTGTGLNPVQQYMQLQQERAMNAMRGEGLYAIPKGMAYSPEQVMQVRSAADGVYNQELGKIKDVIDGMKSKKSTDEMEVGGDFQATIDAAARVESGFGANKRVTQQLMQLAASKDYKSLLVALQGQAQKRMPSIKQTEIIEATNQVASAKRLSKLLQDYSDKGGQTNFLKGKEDDIATYFGKLAVDPEFKAIGVELKLAFQQYRVDTTGAAFSPAESADYASVLPGKGNNLDLNIATLKGLSNYMDAKVNNAYAGIYGEGYANVKALAEGEGQTTRSTNQNTDRKAQDDEALQGHTQEQIDAFKKEHGLGGTSFNSVGNTQASVEIPKSSRLSFVNNNPGNLRFASQEGASQGEGGFARFESPQAGATALQRQIKLDASRGHTLASFINKFAPPSENNTNEYVSQAMKNLGVSSDTKISNIPLDKLTRFMALKESSTKIS